MPEAAATPQNRHRARAVKIASTAYQVFFGVDPDRRLVGLHDDDRDAVLQEAELLQALRALQRGRRQGMEAVERRGPVRVEPDVLVAHGMDPVAVVGDRVFREVEGTALGVAHDLVDAGFRQLLGAGADAERAHLGLRAPLERRHQKLEVSRGDQRLVALDVHVHVGLMMARDLPHAVRARLMSGAGQDGGDPQARADPHDLIGIGGHEHIPEGARPARAVPHVPDHRPPGDLAQDFAGQARGGEPRGDHAENVH